MVECDGWTGSRTGEVPDLVDERGALLKGRGQVERVHLQTPTGVRIGRHIESLEMQTTQKDDTW